VEERLVERLLSTGITVKPVAAVAVVKKLLALLVLELRH
jgi:hypothetical protein